QKELHSCNANVVRGRCGDGYATRDSASRRRRCEGNRRRSRVRHSLSNQDIIKLNVLIAYVQCNSARRQGAVCGLSDQRAIVKRGVLRAVEGERESMKRIRGNATDCDLLQ